MDVPEYLRLLARAESLTGAGQWADAARLWQRVAEMNPVNGNHQDRLAQAYFESGDYAAALAAYEKAAEHGVWERRDERDTAFAGELEYRMACCRARLGDTDGAIDELDRALRAGLRDLDRVRADECWGELSGHDRFRALLDVDVSGLSRDEGWCRDLRLLGREVKRRAYAPFRHIAESEWDARLARLDAAVPELSDAQLLTGILRLLRPLGDGHALLVGPDDNPALGRTLPAEFYLFPEGPYVTMVDPRYRRALGGRVTALGGRPAAEIIDALDPIISRDNVYQVKATAAEYLRHPPLLHALGLIDEPDAVTLGLELLDGSVAEDVRMEIDPAAPTWKVRSTPAGWLRLAETLPGPVPRYLRNRDLEYWFEYLPTERTVYVQLNSIADHPAESLAAFTERLFAFVGRRDVDTFVLDLRWNGGGNTFLTQPLLHRLIGCGQVNRPGGLFVIIGRQTFSAAQNTATAIERHTHAIFVGEPTGSSPNFTGELIPFQLPYSQLLVNVSDLYWQTSWPMDRRPYIAPELYAPPTFADYRAGRDPAMDAIAAYREYLPGRYCPG
jgi:tetratricopeptide (TPR) repeat protein